MLVSGVEVCVKMAKQKAVFVYVVRRKLPSKFWKTTVLTLLQTRLRYRSKRKRYFIDAIIKAPRTKPDKTEVKRVGAIDPGSNPLYTVHTSEGVTITEDAAEREKLFALQAKCEHLVERIAKRNFANQQRRSKQQYDRTTKRLRLKLERMRVSLQNFRTKWHHVESKKIFEYVDVLILNRLDSKIFYNLQNSHTMVSGRKHERTCSPWHLRCLRTKLNGDAETLKGKRL